MDQSQTYTRVKRPENEAESYYSRLSSVYDLLAASEKKFIRQGLELLNPSEGERILEIGFGTGYAQLTIAKMVVAGVSIGLDISEGMSQITRAKVIRSGLSDRTWLVRSNTLPIPFEGGIFDGIFSSFTLELFDSPQIPEILEECRRVLKPAGRLVVVCLSKDQPLPWMGKLYERLHTRFPRLLDCRPIPVRSLVKDAGFTIKEDRDTRMWGLPVSILLALN